MSKNNQSEEDFNEVTKSIHSLSECNEIIKKIVYSEALSEIFIEIRKNLSINDMRFIFNITNLTHMLVYKQAFHNMFVKSCGPNKEEEKIQNIIKEAIDNRLGQCEVESVLTLQKMLSNAMQGISPQVKEEKICFKYIRTLYDSSSNDTKYSLIVMALEYLTASILGFVKNKYHDIYEQAESIYNCEYKHCKISLDNNGKAIIEWDTNNEIKELVDRGREDTEINLKNSMLGLITEKELPMVLNKMIESHYMLDQFNNSSMPHKLLNYEILESRVQVIDYLWNRLLISKGVIDYKGLNLHERDISVIIQYKDDLLQFSKDIHSMGKNNGVIEYYINELFNKHQPYINDQDPAIETTCILGDTVDNQSQDII